MRLLAVLALALLSPLAAGGPMTDGCYVEPHAPETACVFEQQFSSGSCSAGGFEGRSTAVDLVVADTYFTSEGSRSCERTDNATSESSTLALGYYSGDRHVSLDWSDTTTVDEAGTSRGCYLTLATGTTSRVAPCPAGLGPPDAGWGHVLP